MPRVHNDSPAGFTSGRGLVEVDTTACPKGWVYIAVQKTGNQFRSETLHFSPERAREVAAAINAAADRAEGKEVGVKTPPKTEVTFHLNAASPAALGTMFGLPPATFGTFADVEEDELPEVEDLPLEYALDVVEYIAKRGRSIS